MLNLIDSLTAPNAETETVWMEWFFGVCLHLRIEGRSTRESSKFWANPNPISGEVFEPMKAPDSWILGELRSLNA